MKNMRETSHIIMIKLVTAVIHSKCSQFLNLSDDADDERDDDDDDIDDDDDDDDDDDFALFHFS